MTVFVFQEVHLPGRVGSVGALSQWNRILGHNPGHNPGQKLSGQPQVNNPIGRKPPAEKPFRTHILLLNYTLDVCQIRQRIYVYTVRCHSARKIKRHRLLQRCSILFELCFFYGIIVVIVMVTEVQFVFTVSSISCSSSDQLDGLSDEVACQMCVFPCKLPLR